MTYFLSIQHEERTVLTATMIKGPQEEMRVTSACLDNDAAGLTVQGADAFRCMALGELVIALALGVPSEDPFAARVRLLEAENARLRAELVAGLETTNAKVRDADLTKNTTTEG